MNWPGIKSNFSFGSITNFHVWFVILLIEVMDAECHIFKIEIKFSLIKSEKKLIVLFKDSQKKRCILIH